MLVNSCSQPTGEGLLGTRLARVGWEQDWRGSAGNKTGEGRLGTRLARVGWEQDYYWAGRLLLIAIHVTIVLLGP